MIESPHSEAAVLGSMILDKSVWPVVCGLVGVDDFYRPEHKVIWEGLMAIHPNAEPDLVLLRNVLIRSGTLKQLDDDPNEAVQYLVSVAESVPSAASAEYYAREVRLFSDKRKIEQIGLRINDFNGEPIQDQLAEIHEMLATIKPQTDTQPTHHEACALAMEEFEQPVTALSTGFVELDNRIVGLEPGLIVVGGTASMGKTTLALSITSNVCLAGKKVLYVSREMTRGQLLHRLFGMFANIPLVSIRDRSAGLAEVQRGASEVMGWDLLIDVKAGTYQEVGAAMDKMGEVDLVVVDYLQLMEGAKANNKHLETFDVVKGLKRLGTDRLVPVMLLSQLNQGHNQRAEFKPRMGDLKESGSIGDSANVVLLLYRKDYYIERGIFEGDLDNKVVVSIAKQQQGAPGFAVLKFEKEYVRFDNYKDET